MLRRLKITLQSCHRESEKGWSYAMGWFLRRFYFRFVVRRCLPEPRFGAADLERPLTVVVPATDKDAPALALCLRYARDMIRHPLKMVCVVAPNSSAIRRIAAENGCTFVHEDEFLPRPAADLRTRGWVIQQLIKLIACARLDTSDCLVLDSDTIFLRPQVFFRRGKTLLKFSDQYELLYNPSLELLLGTKRRFPVSFVTHHMVLNRERVALLLESIERKFNRPWFEVLIHEVNHACSVSLSEFEMYGNFVAAGSDFPRFFALQHWRGLDSTCHTLKDFNAARRQQLEKRYDSVSFHWYTE